ncbi:MAG TPA: ABC transporter substrate-binding protein [Solirubrobacteraceae bacterium]|nr:ABC transporter substrate-binding protein [Solirubrobacteraceae bacterium]
MHRRRLSRGATLAAGAAALALAAAGCGGGSGKSGGSSGSSTAASSGGSTGQTLVVANTSSVQKLDPAVMTNFLDFQALGMIYQPLVTLNRALQVQPALATSWHVGDGGRSLTFALRHGVRFDDGSPLTSADVKATMAYIVKPSTGAAAASYLASVASVSTPSRYTVVFHLSHPDSSLLDGLTSENLAIISAKAIKAGTLATKPDGTGPYEYAFYSPNNSFTVARNPRYWGPAPKIPRIEFKTIANEQSIASALQAGTVQLGLLTEPQVTQQLQGQSITVDKQLDLNYRALMLQSKGPLANVDARLAIQCAIDRRAVLQAAVLGGGKVVGPVPQGPFASDPSAGTCATQNLAQAKAYLAKAGKPKGFSFTVLTSNDLDGTSNAQATTIQNELGKVGIKMSIDNVASSQYIQQWLKGKFQAALAENGANPSPYIMYGRYFGARASLAVPAGYSSPTLKSLLLRADQSNSRSTQATLYRQFTNELTDNAVWVWLFNAYDYYAASPHLQGFTPLPSGQLTGLATARLS